MILLRISFAGLLADLSYGYSVDNNNQAWLPLNVLDIIEIF